MEPVWVKICGVTRLEDALVAVEAGADAVGFVLVPSSPRALQRDRIEEILKALPRTVLTVGVVADEDPEFLHDLLRICPFGALQFHGEESPEQVLMFKGKVRTIKAFRVKSQEVLKEIPKYRGVDAVLLDAYDPNRLGGTGISLDWSWVQQAKTFGIPVIVAGGLTPQNVGYVVKQVAPYGVDVSSGVESSVGKKDPNLVRQFIRQAKSSLLSRSG